MTETQEDDDELKRLQRECLLLSQTLKQLERQELDLQCQNQILAREALLCGFDPKLLEPPPPKRKRTPAKRKSTTTPTPPPTTTTTTTSSHDDTGKLTS